MRTAGNAEDWLVHAESDLAMALTPFAVQYRYPGDEGPPGEQEVRAAVALADRAIRWARERVRASQGD